MDHRNIDVVEVVIAVAIALAVIGAFWFGLGALGVAADDGYPGPAATVDAYPRPAIEMPAYPAPGTRDTPPPWLGPTLTAIAQATPDNVPAMVDDGAVSVVATAMDAPTTAPTVTARPRSRHSNPTAVPTATPFPWRRLFLVLRGAL